MKKEFLPHEQRVVDERNELLDKKKKLFDFFKTDTFKSLESGDRDLLAEQEYHMRMYLSVLNTRILRFVKNGQ